jgi:NAD(P)-dependent dehydrogenase (short-subunit alcohol dehydrogenase family)
VDACIKAYGRIDILLNNVGILAVDGPEELPEEVWDRQLAVNVKSVFLSCKYILPILVRQSTSAIVIFRPSLPSAIPGTRRSLTTLRRAHSTSLPRTLPFNMPLRASVQTVYFPG